MVCSIWAWQLAGGRAQHPQDVVVRPVAAEALIVARVAEQQVEALAAGEAVVAGVAVELVVAFSTEQPVQAGSAADAIVAGVAS